MKLPPEPDSHLIHTRNYDVRAYRESSDQLRLRGTIHDFKPAGHYFTDDPEELDIHLMVIDLLLDFPSLLITEAEVVMEVVPHGLCRSIAPKYSQLVGLSIARGFARKVKELYAGPAGCTHVGALLSAMAPVAIQSMWSMKRMADIAESEAKAEVTVDPETVVAIESSEVMGRDPDARDRSRQLALAYNLDSCHVWGADGDFIRALKEGEELELPVWATERLEKLGRPLSDWGE